MNNPFYKAVMTTVPTVSTQRTCQTCGGCVYDNSARRFAMAVKTYLLMYPAGEKFIQDGQSMVFFTYHTWCAPDARKFVEWKNLEFLGPAFS